MTQPNPTRAWRRPEPTNLHVADVHKLASKFAEQTGFDATSRETEVRRIVKNLGGVVFDGGGRESMIVWDRSEFEMYIPEHLSPDVARREIAHNLGHYALHYLWPLQNGGPEQVLRVPRYSSDRTEWEANWFMAGLLMPEPSFRRIWLETNGDIEHLSKTFWVAEYLIEARSQALHLSRKTNELLAN